MPKKFLVLIIIGCFLLLLAGGILYLNNVFLPTFAKDKIAATLTDLTGHPAQVGGVSISLFKGLEITDILITDRASPDDEILRLGKISSALLILPFFREKKIIIPFLRIERLDLFLRRNKDLSFNISSLLGNLSSPQKTAAARPQPLIKSLTIRDTRIRFTDDTFSPSVSAEIDGITVDTDVSWDKITATASAVLKRQGHTSPLTVKAEYQISKKSLHAELQAGDIPWSLFQEYLVGLPVNITTKKFPQITLSLTKNTTTTLLDLDFTCDEFHLAHPTADVSCPSLSAHLQTSLADSDLKSAPWNGRLTIPAGRFDIKTPLIATGQFKDATATFEMAQKIVKAKISLTTEQTGLDHPSITVNGLQAAIDLSTEIPVDQISAVASRGTMDIVTANASFKSEKLSALGTIADSSLSWSTQGTTADLTVSKASMKKLKADFEAIHIDDLSATGQVKTNIDWTDRSNIKITYAGQANLDAAQVNGLPYIQTAQKPQADIVFDTQRLTIRQAQAEILKTLLTAQGEITKENIRVSVKTQDADLSAIIRLLPSQFPMVSSDLKGFASIDIQCQTDLVHRSLTSLTGEARLKDISFSLAGSQTRFSSPDGVVRFDHARENFQWHFPSVTGFNRLWSLDGASSGYATPKITATLLSDDIKTTGEFTKFKNHLKIDSLSSQFYKSKADITGTWDLKKDIDLSGIILLDTADLSRWLESTRPQNFTRDLSGLCQFDVSVTGRIDDWRQWNVKAQGQSPQLKSHGISLTDLSLEYFQSSGTGKINRLSFAAYGGKGQLQSKIDLSEPALVHSTQILLERLDLGLLRADTPLKNKTLYGLLTVTADMRGPLLDIKALKGEGDLSITDGNIWEFDPLKGLGSFIFLPGFASLSFKEAKGTFFVQDGYVATEGIRITGPTLALVLEGKIGFEGNLDLLVNSQLIPQLKGDDAQAAADQAESDTQPQSGSSIKDIPVIGAFLQKDGLSAVRITGTFSNPKTQLLPVGENIKKKLGEFLSNISPI